MDEVHECKWHTYDNMYLHKPLKTKVMKTYNYFKSTTLKAVAVTFQLLMPCIVSAATFTAIASGSWSSSATWAGGIAPGSTLSTADQVYIGAAFDVALLVVLMLRSAFALPSNWADAPNEAEPSKLRAEPDCRSMVPF